METSAETQERKIDLTELRVRIVRLGDHYPRMKRQPYRHISAKLNRAESTITAAMLGKNETTLPRIVRYVEYLERKAEEKKNLGASIARASSTLRTIGKTVEQ